MTGRCLSVVFGLLLLFLLHTGPLGASEDDWLRPLGPPPKAKPRRISGGESFPPLPLPATPLRRSERKREPTPPKLIGKVMWGESASFSYANGAKAQVSDWNMCPGDVQSLLRKASSFLGTPYHYEALPLTRFHGDPEKTPVLFFSGGRTLRFDEEQMTLLRRYVRSGGLLVFDSIAGSPYFYRSACERAAEMFPEVTRRVLPLDHPIYHMLYDIETVHYPRNLESTTPHLEGLYIGCRVGILISRYGLGVGWDNREVPLIEKAVYYDVKSANEIGLNLIAYAVGYGHVGREEAKPELFGALDEKRPTDEFVFAQVRHGGAWNVHPGAAAALLRRLRHDTALRVSLKRIPVTPGRDRLDDFPFLYLTGLDDFSWSAAEAQALSAFLRRGGTLFINNGLGLSTFDTAVRRELKKLLPEAALQPLPIEHPLFTTVFNTRAVRYTPAAAARDPERTAPVFAGIQLDGDLRILYSRFDVEAGWLGVEHPLCLGYETHSATQLGINAVVYAVTH